jgi:uncharacterized protein with GYD domain
MLEKILRFHARKGRICMMYFIGLVNFKKKQTKEVVAGNMKRIEAETRQGVKVHGIYWTLGRYDAVAIFEAPDEKTAMKMAISRADGMNMETLVAVPLEEAKKLVGDM